jgi:hypothetical protein
LPRRWLSETPAAVARVVAEDLSLLQQGQVKPTQGDTRCIIFGHLIRLAVWHLRSSWKTDVTTPDRMAVVQRWTKEFGGVEAVIEQLGTAYTTAEAQQNWQLSETGPPYTTRTDEISF